jgi:hypothetical protein
VRKINQKGYKWYVLVSELDAPWFVETGWEFKEDAKEHTRDNLPKTWAHRVVAKSTLVRSWGLDPDQNASWAQPTKRNPRGRTGADMDTAAYLGDGEAGVYVDVKKRRAGWFVVASMDSPHVLESFSDDGPYKTRLDAAQAAVDTAVDWGFDNDVRITKKDQKAALKFLMSE